MSRPVQQTSTPYELTHPLPALYLLWAHSDVRETAQVLSRSYEHRRQALTYLASHFYEVTNKIKKIKSVFHNMNKFSDDASRKVPPRLHSHSHVNID
jgi:hypothetical protein